jgi:hypothetical protein
MSFEMPYPNRKDLAPPYRRSAAVDRSCRPARGVRVCREPAAREPEGGRAGRRIDDGLEDGTVGGPRGLRTWFFENPIPRRSRIGLASTSRLRRDSELPRQCELATAAAGLIRTTYRSGI